MTRPPEPDPRLDGEDEAWRPRRNDHLVEPFFGGLDVEAQEDETPEPEGEPSGGWWRRLLERLRRR